MSDRTVSKSWYMAYNLEPFLTPYTYHVSEYMKTLHKVKHPPVCVMFVYRMYHIIKVFCISTFYSKRVVF